MKYVIVTLMLSGCPESQTPARCVMSVLGPFDTRDAAEEHAGTLPEWTTPHLMTLTDPRGPLA